MEEGIKPTHPPLEVLRPAQVGRTSSYWPLPSRRMPRMNDSPVARSPYGSPGGSSPRVAPAASQTAIFRSRLVCKFASRNLRTCRSEPCVRHRHSIVSQVSFQVDLAWRAHRAGLVIVEVPITFTERERGASKMSRAIVLEALWRVTQWSLQAKRRGVAALPDRGDPNSRRGRSEAGRKLLDGGYSAPIKERTPSPRHRR